MNNPFFRLPSRRCNQNASPPSLTTFSRKFTRESKRKTSPKKLKQQLNPFTFPFPFPFPFVSNPINTKHTHHMDHYKVLGLHKTASKEEIKAAFKKLAFQFHPDKHSQSPKAVRENATLRFKQVSEAYEVLMDDRKRADYHYRWRSGAGGQSATAAGNNNYYSQYSYGYNRSGNNYEYKYRSGFNAGGGFASKFELAIRILTARSSLLNLGFAAAILGGIVVIDASGESLWKMQNSGKTFEEAIESIEKAKAYREDNMKERP